MIKYWTFVGKLKLVISQLGIYFSIFSMIGITITTWHTTISPILESHGISTSPWWLIIALGVFFVVLTVFEWCSGMPGYIRSFTHHFYSADSQLRQDINELKVEVHELKELLKK